ncbi:hypothetical protein TNCV_3092541 [Trichonephila clavipes]|uniref:Uncharacterized protein n=1 Tax=Trichonephila clavipes TaxID=2585209 RepID=A0A8X6S2J2_TRICX|nr:hypothetical protein TNCV_3092541 [Trichonephila clavipes]
MWSMVSQRLTQITPPAATPDQLLQRVQADWSVEPQEHIQSLFESMPRLVAARFVIESLRKPKGKLISSQWVLGHDGVCVVNSAMNGRHWQGIDTTLCLLTSPVSACNIRMVGIDFEDIVASGY